MAPTVVQILERLDRLGISEKAGNLHLVPGYADTKIEAHQGTWDPAYVVLHDTGTGIPTAKLKPAQSLGWMVSPGNLAPIRAAHFLIGRDGVVHFVYAYACYHAGLGGPYGPNAGTPGDTNVDESVMNTRAFGIEHESSGLSWDLTTPQVVNGAKVTAALLDAMGKGVQNALNHKDWTDVTQKDGRTRPGKYAGRKVDTRQSREWWWKQIIPHLATLSGPTVGRVVVGGHTPVTAREIAHILGISWARVVRFNGRLLLSRAKPGSVVRIPPGVPVRPIYRDAPTA